MFTRSKFGSEGRGMLLVFGMGNSTSHSGEGFHGETLEQTTHTIILEEPEMRQAPLTGKAFGL